MKVHFMFIGVLLGSASLVYAEQKMLFNVESVQHTTAMSTKTCQTACDEKYNDPPLPEMQTLGWKIITATAKEAVGIDYDPNNGYPWGCTCKGTQYVLQKEDSPTTPSKNEKLLKQENKLLKREIILLKQENENLKEKLKIRKRNKTSGDLQNEH